MKTIYKYPLAPFGDIVTIQMPSNSVPLRVDVHTPTPTLWAMVETDNPLQDYRFLICGTGNPIPDYHGTYLNTFFMGPFVWHVFVL